VGPLGGTRCGTYDPSWIYGMGMPVLDIWTWPRGDVPQLGLTIGDVGILRGWIVTSWLMALIGLLEYSCHQGIPSILKVQLQRTLGLSVLGPEQF
jgi:hypothetical protein